MCPTFHLFFAHAFRVLKNRGRFVSLDMFPPRKTWFSAFYSLYFYRLVPWIGGLLAHDRVAYRYLAESVENFHPPERVAELLEQAGFKQVTYSKVSQRGSLYARGRKTQRIATYIVGPCGLFPAVFSYFSIRSALGGLFGLSATPFHELERAFYKSTAGVLFVIAVLGFWGKSHLYWQNISAENSFATAAEILFHGLFVISFAAYMISLWGENQAFRARSFASCVLCGYDRTHF